LRNPVKRKAVLYVGASKPQIPGILAAKRAGLHTVVTDISPTPAGAEYGDCHARISATDTDGLIKLAHKISDEMSLVGCYGIADYAYKAIGLINREFHLPGGDSESYALAANKDDSKKIWQKACVPVTEAIILTSEDKVSHVLKQLEENTSSAFVVKPASSNNSKGVSIINSPGTRELKVAIELALEQSARVLIEQFVRGRHINADLLMLEGQAYPVACTERWFAGDPGTETSWGVQPAAITSETEENLYRLTSEAAAHLGLLTGPMTADIILSDKGPVLLEISPHYHTIMCNSFRDGGNSIQAWFQYLSELKKREIQIDNNREPVAYVNLIGSRSDVEELTEVLSREAEIVDYDDRKSTALEAARILWLKGKDCRSSGNILEVSLREALQETGLK